MNDADTTWATLAEALTARRPVRARYHGADRILCPHALGWKNGRPKVLSYQAAGSTTDGPLNVPSQQRWRSMFVDEIEAATIITDGAWETAANYSPNTNGIGQISLSIPLN